MAINEEAHFNMTRARIFLITEHPFFGALAMHLKMKQRPDIPTLAVDGKTVYYNPEFVNSLTHSLRKSALAHEVGHCIFDHITRRGDRNPVKWNMAGDYVINEMLEKSGLEIGEGWLRNKAWDDFTADHIYTLLPDQPEGGEGNGGALCEIWQAQENPQQVSSEWQVAIAQAAHAAKSAGKLPAQFERFVDDLLSPKVPWQTILRHFMTEIRRDDYSWARPKKSMMAYDLYLPTLHNEGMGEIMVVVDTSGSIDQKTLNAFASEINAIRDAVKPRLTRVVYCDAAVNHVDEFETYDECKLKMHGGGSTDFRPPFELVNARGWKPTCGVYLTDGYGPFPDAQPDFPFMWCMTTDVQAPWGHNLRIEID